MAESTENKASTSAESAKQLKSLSGLIWDRHEEVSLRKIPPPPPPPWKASLTLFGDKKEIMEAAERLSRMGVQF